MDIPDPASPTAVMDGCKCWKNEHGYQIPSDCPVHVVWVGFGAREEMAYTHFQLRYPTANRVENFSDEDQLEAASYRWHRDTVEIDDDFVARTRNV